MPTLHREDSAVGSQSEKTQSQCPQRFDPNLFPVATDLTPIQEEEEDGNDELATIGSTVAIPQDISVETAIAIIYASIDTTTNLSSFSTRDTRTVESIRTASITDKAFGHGVAETTISLRGWCEEIAMWPWADSFEIPQDMKKYQNQLLEDRSGNVPTPPSTLSDDDFWGSLPAEQILYYEDRLEDIMSSLHDLNMNEQKNHILSMCSPSKMDDDEDPDSAVDPQSPTENARPALLVDLIVNMFMQAIASHGQLKSLIGAWHARIDVLRLVPSFVEEIENTTQALRQASALLQRGTVPTSKGDDRIRTTRLSKELYQDTRTDLEERVKTTAAHIDEMLDILEESEDILPDCWIDDVDELEQAFAKWCEAAEGKFAPSAQPHCNYTLPQGKGNKAMLASAAEAALGVLAVPRSSTSNRHQHLHDSEVEVMVSIKGGESVKITSQMPLSARRSRQNLKIAKSRQELRVLIPGKIERNDAAVVPVRLGIPRKPIAER